MNRKIFLILNLVLVLSVNGCSNKGNSQATPKDAVRMFMDGFMEFDEAKVMAVVSGDGSEIKALSVFMDYMREVRDFKEAVIEEYGTSGWTHFENEGGAKLSLNLTDYRSEIDSAKIEINGDKATFAIPGETQKINLFRKNGLWYIDAAGIVDSGDTDIQKFIRLWSSLTNAIRKSQGKIGQPGVTAESLDKELGDELLPIFMSIQ